MIERYVSIARSQQASNRLPIAFLGASLSAALCGAMITEAPLAVALLVAVVAGAILAGFSPAVPVGLVGLPTLVISVLGHNPFPSGGVRLAMFFWTAAAIVAFAARHRLNLGGALAVAPVVCSVVIAVLFFARLPASRAAAYGSLKAESFVAVNLLLVVAGVCIGVRRRDFTVFLWLTLFAAVASGILLIRGLNAGALSPTIGGRYSLTAEEHPIELGRDSAAGLLVAVYFLLSHASRYARAVSLASLPLLAIALLASGSRGPVLGLAVGLLSLVALTMRERRNRNRLLGVVAAFAAAVAVVPSFVPAHDIARSLGAFVLNGSGVSSNGRSQLWHEAFSLFLRHPLLGAGTGSFAALDPVKVYPHNVVLEVGAELGLVGVLALLAALWVTSRGLIRVLRSMTPVAPRVDTVLVLAFFGMSLVNALLSGDVRTNGALWLSMGLATGLTQRMRPMPGFTLAQDSQSART